MNIPHNLRKKLLPILVNRSVTFLFIMCLLTLFLYTIGTNQGFVDATQFNLLKAYSVFAIFLVTMSICGIVLNVIRFSAQKKARYLLRAGAYLLLVIFGSATVLAIMFIFTISAGNYVYG